MKILLRADTPSRTFIFNSTMLFSHFVFINTGVGSTKDAQWMWALQLSRCLIKNKCKYHRSDVKAWKTREIFFSQQHVSMHAAMSMEDEFWRDPILVHHKFRLNATTHPLMENIVRLNRGTTLNCPISAANLSINFARWCSTQSFKIHNSNPDRVDCVPTFW